MDSDTSLDGLLVPAPDYWQRIATAREREMAALLAKAEAIIDHCEMMSPYVIKAVVRELLAALQVDHP